MRVAILMRLGVCGLLFACDGKLATRQEQTKYTMAQASQLEDEPIGYSSGAWWQDEDLNTLLLRASQIVVSYADAESVGAPVPFVAPARTKDDALRIIRSLRAELRAHPARFSELAKRHSDEPVSAAMGGALGNFFALSMPREIVDALGQTGLGEVSRIVETAQGYHLLARHAPVTEGKLAFAHLVIKHAGATGFRREDRAPIERTREQARALASMLAAQAAERPETFASLVQRHSEAEDALRDGDLGLWSRTKLIESEFLLFEAASRLALGAVSGTIETASGFHVLQRTSDEPRQVLGMSAITLLHDASQLQAVQATTTRTKAQAVESALGLLAELRAHPQRFAQRQRERCEAAYCDGVFAFEQGRGPPALERALRRLQVGQLLREPVETPFGLVLLRREDPALAHAIAQAKLRTEFPTPGAEPARASASDAKMRSQTPAEAQRSPAQLLANLRQFERYAFGKMRLSGAERSEIRAILSEFAQAVTQGGERDAERDAQRVDERLAQLLGASKHEELTRHRRAFFAERAQ